jgi:hypothetical protein
VRAHSAKAPSLCAHVAASFHDRLGRVFIEQPFPVLWVNRGASNGRHDGMALHARLRLRAIKAVLNDIAALPAHGAIGVRHGSTGLAALQ